MCLNCFAQTWEVIFQSCHTDAQTLYWNFWEQGNWKKSLLFFFPMDISNAQKKYLTHATIPEIKGLLELQMKSTN